MVKTFLIATLLIVTNLISFSQEYTQEYITPKDTTKYFSSLPVREIDSKVLFRKYPWLHNVINETMTEFESNSIEDNFDKCIYYVFLETQLYKGNSWLVQFFNNAIIANLPPNSRKYKTYIRPNDWGVLLYDPEKGYIPSTDGSFAYIIFNNHPVFINDTPEIADIPSTGNVRDLDLMHFYLDDSPTTGWKIDEGKASKMHYSEFGL